MVALSKAGDLVVLVAGWEVRVSVGRIRICDILVVMVGPSHPATAEVQIVTANVAIAAAAAAAAAVAATAVVATVTRTGVRIMAGTAVGSVGAVVLDTAADPIVIVMGIAIVRPIVNVSVVVRMRDRGDVAVDRDREARSLRIRIGIGVRRINMEAVGEIDRRIGIGIGIGVRGDKGWLTICIISQVSL